MTKHSGVFVKINYKMEGLMKGQRGNRAGSYRNSKDNKFVICGGVYNRNGGTIIFHASDFAEAEKIVNNNPFINSREYSFEILSKNSISLAAC